MAAKSALKGKCFVKLIVRSNIEMTSFSGGKGGQGTEKDVIIGIKKCQMQAGNFLFL